MKRKMYFHDVLSLVSGFLEDNANFQIFAVKMGFSYDDLANSNLNGLLGPFLRSPQGLDILKYGERSTYDPMKPFIEAALGRTRGKPATTHDIVTLVACFLYDNANFQIYAVNHGYTYSDLADAELDGLWSKAKPQILKMIDMRRELKEQEAGA